MSTFSATTSEPVVAQTAAENEVSLPLYIAGLIAILAGIVAVGNEMSLLDGARFAQFTLTLATAGVITSYFLRRLGVAALWVKLGSVALCVVFFSAMRGIGPFASLIPVNVMMSAGQGDGESTGSSLLMLTCALALTATFGSFFLVTNDAVIFASVFSIALIGLTATVNNNSEVITCFIVFLTAAAFLLVHENYLQNRSARSRPRSHMLLGEISPALLRAQLFVGFAAAGAAALAGGLLAMPIQIMGKNHSLRQQMQLMPAPAMLLGASSVSGPRGLSFDDPQRFEVGLGEVKGDSRVVLVVEGEKTFYWRGRTYEIYTGSGWETRTDELRETIYPREGSTNPYIFDLPDRPRPNTRRYRHIFLPQQSALYTLYCAAEPRMISTDVARISHRPDSTLGIPLLGFRPMASYTIESDVSEPTPQELQHSGNRYPPEIRDEYTGIAPENAALAEMAQSITVGLSDPYSRAEAIRSFVAQRCAYSLKAPAVPRARDAAEYFLNDSRVGYCDLYATAVTVLCRYAGLPARVVTGFDPGTPDPEKPNRYLLTGNDKHAWAEVYFNSYGWVPFDATTDTRLATVAPKKTPAATAASLWQRWLLARGPVPMALGVLGVLLFLYVLGTELVPRLTFRRSGGTGSDAASVIAVIYRRTTRRIARHGVERAPAMTPAAYQEKVAAYLGNPTAAPLRPLTLAAERAFYSGQTLTAADVAAARSAAQAVTRALRQKGNSRGRKAIVVSK